MKKYYWVLFISIFVLSCGSGAEQQMIQGKWKTVGMYGDTLLPKVDYQRIKFAFWPNGSYDYDSFGVYEETGKYHIRGNMLYTSPKEGKERRVQIVRLTSDTLNLKMKVKDKTQGLILERF